MNNSKGPTWEAMFPASSGKGETGRRLAEGQYKHRFNLNESASLVKRRLASMGGRATHSRLLRSLSGSLHALELEEVEQTLLAAGRIQRVGKIVELIVD